MDNPSDKSKAALEHQLRLSQAAFKTAAESPDFLAACKQLLQADKSYRMAADASRTAYGKYWEKKSQSGEALPLDSIRRIARGIPSLGDFGRVFLPARGSANPEMSKLKQAADEAAKQEAKAQKELELCRESFSEKQSILEERASELVRARNAFEQASGTAGPLDDEQFAAQVLQEITQLPAVAGLEGYICSSQHAEGDCSGGFCSSFLMPSKGL